MVKELDELRAKVRRLEATLERKGGRRGGEAGPGNEGSGMKGKEMGMADKGMKGKGMGDKGMMGKGMGLGDKKKTDSGIMGKGMMGRGPKMGRMAMQSALPGFPGASHIYHIGETGFFLDHPEHITLTDDQQKKLNDIKTATMLADGTFERQIDEMEQQMWVLTSAGEPDIKKIEAKIREIDKLSGDRRLAYIRGIGEAGEVLTDDQRQTLMGEHAPKGGQP